MLWDDMVSLPLFAEPTVLVWSRTIGGVHADAAQHQPAVVRAAVGGAGAGVDQQHHAVAAGAVGGPGSGPAAVARREAEVRVSRRRATISGRCVPVASSSEWRNRQTRQLEGLVPARAWGFKSPLRHPSLTRDKCTDGHRGSVVA